MPLSWLFAWWNAIYSVPLVFVLVLLTVTSVVSLVTGGIGEHHEGAHDSAELDHAGEAEVDLHHDGTGDGVGHASHGNGHHGEPGPLLSVLMLLGVGKAPLMLVLQVLVLLFGLIGISLHRLSGAGGPLALVWSLPLTLLLSAGATRAFAHTLARFYRPVDTQSLKQEQLAGRTGRVVYPVNADSGTIHVRDGYGTLHRVRARSRGAVLPSGSEVVVLSWDPQRQVYEVDDPAAVLRRG